MLNRLPATRKTFRISRRVEGRPAIRSRGDETPSAARREVHAAIDIFIGRDAKIVGRRGSRTVDHGSSLWRAVDHGAYLAGALWPPIFARLIAYAGWRHAMLYYAAFELLLIVPAAVLVLAPPPQQERHPRKHEPGAPKSVLGWPPNLVFALQMVAIFTCCLPMAMPQTHLVAFCSDLGISAAHGAAMLSVLLGAAFFSRQLWGLVSDRIGGLYTMLVGSACQALGMAAFLFTQDEVGLFTVAALLAPDSADSCRPIF